MDKRTSKSVKQAFGTNFQQYCERHKIILKQDKCGTYMAPNADVLTECIDVLDHIKLQINKRLRKIERLKPPLKPKDNKNYSNKENKEHKKIPLGLFGKLTNLKKVRKAMSHLLITPRFKSFDLLPLILKLDISSIAWLKNLQTLKTQWLVLAKFIKWFFTGFLIKILCIQFHVTTVSTRNYQRLYITRSNWCSVQRQFIKKKILSNALQPEVKYKQWTPPIGTFMLRPKGSSVRPIFLSKYKEKDKSDIRIVFKFLKQLQITEYGETSFQEKWKSVMKLKHTSKTKKFYLISSDVKDAFGSIIQGHLYNIIRSLSKNLPKVLLISTYAVKSAGKSIDNNTLCYKEYFSNGNLQLPLSAGTLYARTSHSNSLRMQKRWLLQRIRKYIFHQRVQVGKQTYIIGKGVVQGTMLSPILSEIYYNFVLQKQMTLFTNRGEIIRYVDDILYITDNEVFAKQFLQFVQEGIPQYNCYFKKLKTQSNIANSTNTITYIGYNINCDTLEVEPKYTNTRLQYIARLSIKNNLTVMKCFEKRVCSMPCLKLSKVVLDSHVNTKKTVTKILQQACLLQAKRTQALRRQLFNDVQQNARRIFIIIKNSNIKITKYILKILLTFHEKMWQSTQRIWYKKILKMLWVSYKNIFKKDKMFKKYFQKIYIQ
ncbi:telomerase reverse transcriptase isoform X2 [Nomia melanderi]|uniref:telomerase reverse transcriptase isoform X2 n=1 Tax=Nomia melanderi TaxID=2448451 RepID=UPI001304206C|nr:telomerase reverse transcriptase-like isoform X2 [Nomia melanderi]